MTHQDTTETLRTSASTSLVTVGSAGLLTAAEFQGLSELPTELERFANIDNPRTRRAYQADLRDFTAFRVAKGELGRVQTLPSLSTVACSQKVAGAAERVPDDPCLFPPEQVQSYTWGGLGQVPASP